MTRLRRIANVVVGLVMIVCAVDLLIDPKGGLVLVAMVLGLGLLLYGMRMLVYYLTMARHMAGGLSILFIAVLALDVGSFSIALVDNPQVFCILYLVGYNAITGVIAVARGIEAKKFESHWKLSVVHGIVNMILALACIVFAGSESIVIYIFCFGLVYRACVRIAEAMRPTEIVFIK